MIVVVGVLGALIVVSLFVVGRWQRGMALRRRLNLCHGEIERLAARATAAEELLALIVETLREIRGTHATKPDDEKE
jgi:hypothetical protein